ncbi:MAG: hypothetical protein AAB513_02340 [Patescibacteria group bacterium]
MQEKTPTLRESREVLVAKLVASDTPLEEKIAISSQLFPERRKKERLETADIDSKSRPVRYFRMVSYGELESILNSTDENPLTNPAIAESFQRKINEIQLSLKRFLEEEKLYDTLKDEFAELCANFTLVNYQHFVQYKLPRISLFKLHISPYGAGSYLGVTGLSSLSVGAPYQPPSNPAEERGTNKAGLLVVEFSIPSDSVYVHPLFRTMNIEMEKEVNTRTLNSEWVIDVYNGTEDFAERFIKDSQNVLYPEYQHQVENGSVVLDYISERVVWDILQNWKRQESVADLIPVTKLEDINPDNPNLQKPLIG